MEKKIITNLNIIVLISASLIIIFLIIIHYPTISEECIGANLFAKIEYDACYDSSTKNVLLTMKRLDNYKIDSVIFSFIDDKKKKFEITQIPVYNQTKEYEFSASKNPGLVYVNLDIREINNCKEPKTLFLKECDSWVGENLSLMLFLGRYFNFSEEELLAKTYSHSGLILGDLTEDEIISLTKCSSKWIYGEWEECRNGVQKRKCVDENKCPISTNFPYFTRVCDACTENWVCEWSDCKSGLTNPTCHDANNCGTTFSKPEIFNCKTKGECLPDIKCSDWSECNVNYNFQDSINNFNGIKTRLCKDRNECVTPEYQMKDCSLGVDIYIKEIKISDTKYITIYNRLTDEVIAIVKDATNLESPSLDIFF